jgi:bla regulator protein blaR1
VNSAALQYLAASSWVTTCGALLVMLARGPVRGMLGARAAYCLWATVPASTLTLLLPDAAWHSASTAPIAQSIFGWLAAGVDTLFAAIDGSAALAAAAFAVWLTGAAVCSALMILRQRAFVRSLGSLACSPDGSWRSRGVTEPMLIGALRPRVLLPLDFEQRYTAEERELVLAHERAHVRRGDTLVNALGAAWLCVFWFNPLMFWGMRLLRFDQDLACDAAVLAMAGEERRGRYAEALLKAQLAGEAAFPAPLACHWRSVHPLRRRIAALRLPVAGGSRHGVRILCVAALVVSMTVAAHAVQPVLRVTRPTATATGGPSGAAVHRSTAACPLSRRRALLATARSTAVSGARKP